MASRSLRRVKERLLGLLGLSPDAVFVLLGLACFLATCLLAGRPLNWAWALLPGLCLGLLLEGLEIIDHYGLRGFLGLPAAQIGDILFRHSRDVLVLNLGPLLVWLTASLIA